MFATATLADGIAILTTSTLAVGSHVISAEYGGDTDFTISASAVLVMEVEKALTSRISLSRRPPPPPRLPPRSAAREPISLLGSVQFFNGADLLGNRWTLVLGGAASATLSVGAQAGPLPPLTPAVATSSRVPPSQSTSRLPRRPQQAWP